MPVSYPIFNTDPNLQSQAALLDQRQMMAQALLQRGFTPMQGHMAGDVYVGPHPLEALGNLVSAWKGGQGIKQVAQDRASLAAQAYAAQLQANQPQRTPAYTQDQVAGASSQALGEGAAQPNAPAAVSTIGAGAGISPENTTGSPPQLVFTAPTQNRGPTNANAQRMAQTLLGQQPADPGAPFNPRNPNNVPAELLTAIQANYLPKEIAENALKGFEATPATVAARQGGFDPVRANQQAFDKTVVDPTILKLRQAGFSDDQIKRFVYADQAKGAEIDRKAGNQYYNFATGESGMVPKIPENANPVGGIGPNGALPGGVSPIPGATPMTESNSRSAEAGKAPFNIVEYWDPVKQAMVKNYAGNVIEQPPPSARSPEQKVPPKVQAQRDQERLSILRQERAKPTNSAADNAALDREIASVPAGLQSGPSLGAPQTMEAVQKRHADLLAQNQATNTVLGRLDNIADLAHKAIVGPTSEKLRFANNLLALIGSKGAADINAANALLDKNANQIVAAMGGSGGLSTDAGRAIVAAANPNSHMPEKAIREAVDQLKASQYMTQARAAYLVPIYAKGDFNGYASAEAAFDRNADPRIFQWNSIRDPEQKKAFARSAFQQDPNLVKKITELEKIGALNGTR